MSETPTGITAAIKKHWQIVYAVFLIVLVPVLILMNTVFSINTFRRNTDIALQRQALVVGKMFNVAANNSSIRNGPAMQKLIDEIA